MRKRKVIITGSSGYLGQHLLQHLLSESKSNNHEDDDDDDEPMELSIIAAYGSLESFADATFEGSSSGSCQLVKKVQWDFTNSVEVTRLLEEERPDYFVHLAAISSPGVCEKDRGKAMAVNVPTFLVKSLSEMKCKIIFLSTDQVYSGDRSGLPNDRYFLETDVTLPVNVYGQSKLLCEQLMQKGRWTHSES